MFKAWPKIPRWENEKFHFTEKIDGTNACVICTTALNIVVEPTTTPLATLSINGIYHHLWAQSRTRLISPEYDNYGFAKWVIANQEELVKLGPGYHFGEWWGNGINRKYNQTDKKFSLFNTHVWGTHNPNTPTCCSVVPKINASTLAEARQILVEDGSLAAPGFMDPEGVIMYCEKAGTYYKEIINK